MRVEGYTVLYDNEYRGLAQAHGIWPMKWVTVGASWFALDVRARVAVILHEAGHNRRWHKEKRLFFVLLYLLPSLFMPEAWTMRKLRGVSVAHEREADEFAKSKGYGLDLLRGLARASAGECGEFHPSLDERAAWLKG
jgi:hypothetical protein